MRTFLLEYRCTCGYLLFKGLILDARLEIKCKRCGKIQVLSEHSIAQVADRQYALVLNSDGKIVDSSISATTILGYTPSEFSLLKIHEIAPHATIDDFKQIWERTKRLNYIPMIVETFHKTKKGELIPMRARISFPVPKGEVFMLALCEAIDRDHNFKYNPDLLTGSFTIQEFVGEVNAQGFITSMSNELAKKLGYTIYEILGKSLFDFIPKEAVSKFRYEFGLMVSGRQSFFIKNNMFLTKAGKKIKLDTHFSAAFFEDNQMRGFKLSVMPKS